MRGLEFEDFNKFHIVAEACKQQRKRENELNDLRNFAQQFMAAVAVRPVDAVRSVIGNESPVLILLNILLTLMVAKLIKPFYGNGSSSTMFARLHHWFEFSSGHVY